MTPAKKKKWNVQVSLTMCFIFKLRSANFLADRTIGRAFGTVCRLLSVCLLSVTFCIVAKRYVLAKNCLKK